MRFGFVDEHRDVWPIAVMCRVLGVSVSGYYAWRSRPESARSRANRALLDVVRVVHAESGGTYGAPRVHAALQALGRRVGRHRVARPDSGARACAGWPPCLLRVRTTDSRHGHPVAPSRLGRNFEAARPNPVWLADLSRVRTGEGWLFLAAILAPRTRARSGAGRCAGRLARAWIALEALEMAVRRQRPAPGLICHTDRGVQGGLNRSSQRWHRERSSAARPAPRRASASSGSCEVVR